MSLTCTCQCAKRWKEIQQTHLASGASSYSVLSSSSTKNLSSFLNSVLHFTDDKDVNLARQGVRQSLRPATTDTNSQGDHNPIKEGMLWEQSARQVQECQKGKKRGKSVFMRQSKYISQGLLSYIASKGICRWIVYGF